MKAGITVASKCAKVFVVDEHSLVRYGLKKLLTKESGFTVCGEASNHKDALKAIAEALPTLAVIDMTIDGTKGFHLTKSLSKTVPSVKVLILSPFDEDAFAERAIRTGAHGFLAKQEPPERVIEALRFIQNGEIYVSPAIRNKLLTKASRTVAKSQRTKISLLSTRELEIFRLIGKGYRPQAIAAELQVSVKTVNAHREHIKGKLGVRTTKELFEIAVPFVLKDS